jgi:hypothetical protein
MVSALVAAQLLATLALSRPSRSKLHFAVLATAWTALGALAVWTHTVSALAVAASGAYLVGKLRTSLPRAVMLVIGLGFALSPVAVLMVLVEGGSGVLAGGLEHAWSVTRQLPLALSELTGGRAHVIVDGGENVPVPSWVQLTLAVLYGAATVVTLRTRPRGGALMLAGAATLMILASLFPLRATPGAVRFMMPAYVPLVVVLVSGLRARSGAAAWLFVILVGALHLVPLPRLLGEWQKAAHSSVIFPECSLERRMLEAFGIDRGFASYNMAYCITYESGQRTIVSQPWNERFIGHSLPYRDEVRFAGRLAWIVRPGYDFGLHSPAQFERDLRKAGGDWTQIRLGDSRVFLDFEPPFGPWVTRAVPSPVSSGEEVPGVIIYKLPGDRPVHGLTLVPGRRGETLPSDLGVEVSEDGVTYVRVWRQRHLRSNWRLTWLNGHPEPANDGAALAVAVAGRRIVEVRVRYPVPQPEASSVGALLVHEVRNGVWPEGLGDGWRARYEELVSVPRPDTAWWLYRRSVAERNLP